MAVSENSRTNSTIKTVTDNSITASNLTVFNQLEYGAMASALQSFDQGRDKPNTITTVFSNVATYCTSNSHA